MKFRSKFEKRIWDALPSGSGVVYEPPDGKLHYTLPKRYIPDFVLPNGIVIEAKGYFTSADRTKMLRVQKENPGVDIRFLFMRANNRLTKSPNSRTYWQWAEQHGFQWKEGDTIPKEWLNERRKPRRRR